MHRIIIRFKIIKDNRIVDVSLDDRLSFKDNLSFISFLLGCTFKNIKVYDPIKKIFLDLDLPLSEFNIKNYMMLYLF